MVAAPMDKRWVSVISLFPDGNAWLLRSVSNTSYLQYDDDELIRVTVLFARSSWMAPAKGTLRSR